jgi:hypothetical protein
MLEDNQEDNHTPRAGVIGWLVLVSNQIGDPFHAC